MNPTPHTLKHFEFYEDANGLIQLMTNFQVKKVGSCAAIVMSYEDLWELIDKAVTLEMAIFFQKNPEKVHE